MSGSTLELWSIKVFSQDFHLIYLHVLCCCSLHSHCCLVLPYTSRKPIYSVLIRTWGCGSQKHCYDLLHIHAQMIFKIINYQWFIKLSVVHGWLILICMRTLFLGYNLYFYCCDSWLILILNSILLIIIIFL